MRLLHYKRMQWQDRAHFLAVSAQRMRRIVIEQARRNLERGRGIGYDSHLVALDDALNQLQDLDPRKVQVVEMRLFGGLSVEEIAGVLKVSPGPVMRDWSTAKAWLYCKMIARAD